MRALFGLLAVFVLVGLSWLLLREDGGDPPPPDTHGPGMTESDDADRLAEASPIDRGEESRTDLVLGGPEEGRLRVEGTVWDRVLGSKERRGPAAGVKVILRLAISAWPDDSDVEVEVETDEAGFFRHDFDPPTERQKIVRVDLERDAHYRALREDLFLPDEREAGATLATEIERVPHGPLRGRTIDPHGAAIPDVALQFGNYDPNAARSVRSDENGVFVIDDFASLELQSAEKPGYTLVEGRPPTPLEDGGWEPMPIALAATATLVVDARDGDGRPLEGVRVTADLAPSETYGHSSSGWTNSPRKPRNAESGPDGRARLTDVWSGQKLQLTVSHGGGYFRTRRQVDGELRLGADDDELGDAALPIFVPAGRETTLVAQFPHAYQISGIVVDQLGAPVPTATVLVITEDRPPGADGAVYEETKSAEDGTFAVALTAPRVLGLTRITAHRGIGSGFLGFSSSNSGEEKRTGAVWLDLSAQPSRDVEVRVEIEPLQVLAGRLVGPDGEPAGGRVRGRAVGSDRPFGTGPHGFGLASTTAGNGGFQMSMVPAGTYDLRIVPDGPWLPKVVHGVPAGTDDLVVELERGENARVRFDVVGVGAELQTVILLRGRLQPHGDPPLAPPLPRSATYSEPRGWPEAALGLWYGAQGHTDELGSVMFGSSPVDELPVEYELTPGLYWLGAKASDTEGRLCFPIGTGLVEVAPGDYTLRFELVRSLRVRGRVVAPEIDPRWHVALHREGGLVPLDVREDRLSSTAEIGSNGAFVLPSVPSGDFELLVGTARALAEDRPVHRQPLHVGGTEDLEIEVVVEG